MELTDNRGGESYTRYPIQSGEVVLSDRVYGTARGVYAVRNAGAHVVVRLNPHILRVCDEAKKRISLRDREESIPKMGAIEYSLLIPIPPEKRTKSNKPWDLSKAIDWVPSRVVAARTRDGKVIWVLTTLSVDQASSVYLLELYRIRWQIELLFKRLKSLLHLDTLPTREGPTARSWMLARFLAAALAQKLVQPSGPLSPWGYELR
ncbi:MAG: transposase [bacterium]